MRQTFLTRTALHSAFLAIGLTSCMAAAQAAPDDHVTHTETETPQRSLLDRLMHTAPGGCGPSPQEDAAKTSSFGVFARGDGSETGFGPESQYGTPAGMEGPKKVKPVCDQNDPLDAYKHMRLNDSGSIWLSLEGETRIRNWYDHHPVLGSQMPPGKIGDVGGGRYPRNSGRFAVRNLWSADLHLGKHVRFFGQLINADAGGWRPYGYDGTFRKNIDAQQAFVEFSGDLLGGHSGFIFGRQQFLDAPDYMIGNRDVFNVPLTWNGFRVYQIWKRVRVDGFDFVKTKDQHPAGSPQAFRNTEDYSTRLYGVNVTIAPPDFTFMGEKGYSFINLFYYGYKMAGGPAQSTVMSEPSAWGSTTRNNFGLRWHGEAGPLSFSVGGAYQQGVFHQAAMSAYNGRSTVHYDGKHRGVNAFSVNTTADYHFRNVMWKPSVGAQVDIYSGGGARGSTSSMNTYIEPFGVNTNYLDPTNYLTGSNLVNFAPKFAFSPTNYLKVQFKYPFYWRYSTHDDTYSVYGRNIFSRQMNNPENERGAYVGMAPQADVTLNLGPHLTWDQHVVRFMSSHAMRRVGAQSSTYYQSELTFTY
ncbi:MULTISPECIES: alginate export family protein [unclassified Saccharibacter]|uniref:alginate export family protein n=1 Tax=unclassified Saccharibacter TaxID=2648722 RepID=UPI00132C30BD|nr:MULTISPECIES: alginate export family protein [unclassified Saccharibacter]MXV35509.1 alginate export family protein [Saccharibacter sp. EH611]MXV58169.1 alginate export family protein [Saccharibacter sp. EH70]MXV65443.1 alginate export family protein [Saccharibacter sp. EH60]